MFVDATLQKAYTFYAITAQTVCAKGEKYMDHIVPEKIAEEFLSELDCRQTDIRVNLFAVTCLSIEDLADIQYEPMREGMLVAFQTVKLVFDQSVDSISYIPQKQVIKLNPFRKFSVGNFLKDEAHALRKALVHEAAHALDYLAGDEYIPNSCQVGLSNHLYDDMKRLVEQSVLPKRHLIPQPTSVNKSVYDYFMAHEEIDKPSQAVMGEILSGYYQQLVNDGGHPAEYWHQAKRFGDFEEIYTTEVFAKFVEQCTKRSELLGVQKLFPGTYNKLVQIATTIHIQ